MQKILDSFIAAEGMNEKHSRCRLEMGLHLSGKAMGRGPQVWCIPLLGARPKASLHTLAASRCLRTKMRKAWARHKFRHKRSQCLFQGGAFCSICSHMEVSMASVNCCIRPTRALAKTNSEPRSSMQDACSAACERAAGSCTTLSTK